MKAVVLTNGRMHWVYDDHTSICGRRLIDMPVQREIDTDVLDGDVCDVCVNLGASAFGLIPAGRITLKPSYGFLRKQGPTSNGPRSKERGQRLWGDQ